MLGLVFTATTTSFAQSTAIASLLIQTDTDYCKLGDTVLPADGLHKTVYYHFTTIVYSSGCCCGSFMIALLEQTPGLRFHNPQISVCSSQLPFIRILARSDTRTCFIHAHFVLLLQCVLSNLFKMSRTRASPCDSNTSATVTIILWTTYSLLFQDH